MRLIDADELKKTILEHRNDYIDDNFFWTKLFKLLDNAPTVNKCDNCDLMLIAKTHDMSGELPYEE